MTETTEKYRHFGHFIFIKDSMNIIRHIQSDLTSAGKICRYKKRNFKKHIDKSVYFVLRCIP